MIPSPSLCFWCFSCFSCFLVLFRSWYVWPWFIKHQKARQLCFLMHYAVSSTVPQSTKKHDHGGFCFFVIFGFSTVSECRMVSPPFPSSPPPGHYVYQGVFTFISPPPPPLHEINEIHYSTKTHISKY